MKNLLIFVFVLAAVSMASAKGFTTSRSSYRNPAQTGNVGPADVKPKVPATVECKFVVNGSGGPEQNIAMSINGSEAKGDLEANAKPILGEYSGVHSKISFKQVHGDLYTAVIWLTDENTGVQTLSQDFIDFPANKNSSGASAMLLFSKNTRTITMNSKKVELNNVLVSCALVRKPTI